MFAGAGGLDVARLCGLSTLTNQSFLVPMVVTRPMQGRPNLMQLVSDVASRLSKSQHVVLIHVPKCGGVSLHRAMRRHYPMKQSRVSSVATVHAMELVHGFDAAVSHGYEEVLKFREQLLLYYMSDGRPFISGHCTFSALAHRAFGEVYKFVTVLRDPVARFLSSYFYNLKQADTSPWRVDEDLSSFVGSDRGEQAGHQFVKYIGGLREDRAYSSREAVEEAKRSLEKFAVIGVLEEPEPLVEQVQRELGFGIRLGRANRSPVSRGDREAMVDEGIVERIRVICQPDVEVYEHARKLTAARRAGTKSAVGASGATSVGADATIGSVPGSR